MARRAKSMAVLVLVVSCGLASGESATAVTKTTKAGKKVVTTKKKATTTKKRPGTTVRVTTTTASTPAAPTTATTTAAAATAPSTAATTTPPPAPAAGGITVQNFSFVNSPISAKVGVAVTITNLDSGDHTVTAEDGSFSEAVAGNKTASLTVSKAGTFPFRCNIHPTMKGTITVS